MTSSVTVEVVDRGVDFTVRPPGSKSETIRAMAAAALADGRSHIYGGLSADDPKAMASALESFGIDVQIQSEPWVVDGRAGWLGQPAGPIDVGESGLSARIVTAMAASLDGKTMITGSGRLPERPMRGLVEALAAQEVEVSGPRLPFEVAGRGRLWGGNMVVDCSETSQFATALMLMAPTMHEPGTLEIKGLAGSKGYLDITAGTMVKFGADINRTLTGYEIANTGYRPTDIVIEPDASAAAYPLAIAAVNGGRVRIEGLGSDSTQPDIGVGRALAAMGCRLDMGASQITLDARGVELNGIESDLSDAPDGALALVVACLFADTSSHITGLGSLRLKESDRLRALKSEIAKIGGDVETTPDSITIRPAAVHGGLIDPHGDHRIAMSLAVAGTRVAGVAIDRPDVVNKTWPGYWKFLEKVNQA